MGLFRWQQHKYNNQYERVKETLAITPVQIHSPVLYPRSCSISTELFPRHHGIYCSKRRETVELNIYFLIWHFWVTSPAIQLTAITKPEAVAPALASGKKLHFQILWKITLFAYIWNCIYERLQKKWKKVRCCKWNIGTVFLCEGSSPAQNFLSYDSCHIFKTGQQFHFQLSKQLGWNACNKLRVWVHRLGTRE